MGQLILCWSLAQEPHLGQSALDSSASSMDHDQNEAQGSASMPGNQHDPILAVRPPCSGLALLVLPCSAIGKQPKAVPALIHT